MSRGDWIELNHFEMFLGCWRWLHGECCLAGCGVGDAAEELTAFVLGVGVEVAGESCVRCETEVIYALVINELRMKKDF